MNINDYTKDILIRLIYKFNKRNLKYNGKEINRAISVKPKEFYRKYGSSDSNANEEKILNEAVHVLEIDNYVKAERTKYSDDIIKVSLNENSVDEINIFLNTKFNITPRYFKIEEARKLIDKYKDHGELTKYYCNQLQTKIDHTINDIETDREEKILRVLDFIQKNIKELYVREVSMLVFGSSKAFEEQPFYNNVCTIIRDAVNKPADEEFALDDILKEYHIINVDQGILLKGDIIISISGYELSIVNLSNGVSLNSSDIPLIDYIRVKNDKFITIENKTAFYRFTNPSYCAMYLGGYANRHQIELLKKIISENPNIEYYHFGDIDVGGFFIHQHLCRSSSKEFKLYHMGIEDLHNPDYKNCLNELSENDRDRIKSLCKIEPYKEIANVMLQEGIKLEQEIICLNLHDKY